MAVVGPVPNGSNVSRVLKFLWSTHAGSTYSGLPQGVHIEYVSLWFDYNAYRALSES